jgi:lon-related putative ATP-dependent protease
MTKKPVKSANVAAGLPAKALRSACNPDDLGFATTEELAAKTKMIGQDRAIDAINLSASITHKDFNIYLLGQQGTGRRSSAAALLSQQATTRPSAKDWVYVNNFEAPHKPNAISLPTGTAPALKIAMQNLVDDLAHEIPAMFESEDYQTQRRAIEQEFGERHEAPLAEFAELAKSEDVALLRTPMGFMLAAIVDGHTINPETYAKLEADQRDKIDEKIERLQDKLADILKQGPHLEKEHRQRLEDLHVAMAERAVSVRVGEVCTQFAKIDLVQDYLERVRQDMISNAELFLEDKDDSKNGPFPEAIRKYHRDPQFDRYSVNVMVSHSGDAAAGAPVVTEDLPTLAHLTGRIDHVSQMGTLMTNFTLIKPGALHRANGGYLILDARRLLSEPYAWDALKRCLQSQTIAITSLADRLSLSSTISLEPDPVPLDLRVALIGDRRLHMLLQLLDPEFGELFKLQADFEDDLPRNKKSMQQFAQVIAAHAKKTGLLPLTAEAVAAVLDRAVRLADDTRKFTLRIGALEDVMSEADHYARQARRKVTKDADIERAVHQADRRASRIRDRVHEAVTRNTILIDTSGSAVGQINGLSVVGIGEHYFGRPARITARVRMGTGKLIDIEREVELGGPLHSKGVLILAGYLASTFALDVPMSLHASLVFEQSYGGVDGDSASSAELYALLSALSGVPLDQSLAVTGSVNQTGHIQAIGGVNEKIEGFFDICKTRRLTGHQGVLIPASNVDHLMLRQDVVDAAEQGKFRVIPVKTIDEGISLLTGRPAGRRGRSGKFPKESINALVEERLLSFAEARRRFGSKPGPEPETP